MIYVMFQNLKHRLTTLILHVFLYLASLKLFRDRWWLARKADFNENSVVQLEYGLKVCQFQHKISYNDVLWPFLFFLSPPPWKIRKAKKSFFFVSFSVSHFRKKRQMMELTLWMKFLHQGLIFYHISPLSHELLSRD